MAATWALKQKLMYVGGHGVIKNQNKHKILWGLESYVGSNPGFQNTPQPFQSVRTPR